MKRKFKLVTAIASLTAAIALLMFGVYAAGVRTVDVTGTVSFAATNVQATVTVYSNKAATVATTDNEEGTYSFTDTTTNTVGGDITGVDVTLGDDDYTWSYLVVITNTFGTGGASVAVSVVPPTAPAEWVTYTEKSGTDLGALGAFNAAATIPAQGTHYWLFTYVINPAIAPAAANFAIDSEYVLARVNA